MSEEPLVVESIYLYEKENAEAHHTFNFEIVHLKPAIPVLRRGQTFNMALRFNREYVDATDIVRLLFSFGPNPNVLRGTRGVNTVTNREAYLTDLEAWGVRMIGSHGTDLSVEVRSPIDSPVGVWQLNVETNTLGRKKAPYSYSYDKDIYLLFNPWMKGKPRKSDEKSMKSKNRCTPFAWRYFLRQYIYSSLLLFFFFYT